MLRLSSLKLACQPLRRWSPVRHINIFEAVDSDALAQIPMENIRNFSIIAHIDHGKSTLADCLLQLSGNIGDEERRKGQFLDSLKVERERGITVKAVTASMIYEDSRSSPPTRYLLNLIDTPGHIDFAYEVSRSLASCQGALLLVDATQSIQAQSLANYEKAKAQGLVVLPVVTKIDLPTAQPIETALTMGTTFGFEPDSVLWTSAKARLGIEEVLHAIVDQVPPPAVLPRAAINKSAIADEGEEASQFMGRIVDSWFDEHRGVICLIQALSGQLREGSRVTNFASIRASKEDTSFSDHRTEFGVQEAGLMTPAALRTSVLSAGQVGYVVCGMRSTKQARAGDTMYVPAEWTGTRGTVADLLPIPGYEPAKPMLFASVFPVKADDYEGLIAAVDRLCLNDGSLTVARDQSSSLGSGLRIGFLGFLHMEVVSQRLNDEFDMQIVITTPSVPYFVENLLDGTVQEVSSVSNWPDGHSRHVTYRTREPMVKITLVTPAQYYGAMMAIIKDRRGTDFVIESSSGGESGGGDAQMIVTAVVPWQEVVCDLNDQIKHHSAGYVSFNYEPHGYQVSDLVKVEIAVNGVPCDPLSLVCHVSKAESQGRKVVLKLKEVLDRQLFEIVLQAKVGTKILAKERIAPYRKDVLIKSGKLVGGGDISRKKKLLEKQKEGKKRSKMVGRVEISQDAFWSVLQR